jgi:hypothetical protein
MAVWVSCFVFPLVIFAFIIEFLREFYNRITGNKSSDQNENEVKNRNLDEDKINTGNREFREENDKSIESDRLKKE